MKSSMDLLSIGGVTCLLILASTPAQCYLNSSLCSTYTHGLQHDQLNSKIDEVRNGLQTIKEEYLYQVFRGCLENHPGYNGDFRNTKGCNVHNGMTEEDCDIVDEAACDTQIVSHLTNLPTLPPVAQGSNRGDNCMAYRRSVIYHLVVFLSEMSEMIRDTSIHPTFYSAMKNITDITCLLYEECTDCDHIGSPTSTALIGYHLHMQNMEELHHIQVKLGEYKANLHQCVQPSQNGKRSAQQFYRYLFSGI